MASFMANNEKILDTSSNTNLNFSPKSSEIFHFEAGTVKVPGLKRKIGVTGRVGLVFLAWTATILGHELKINDY